MAARSCVCVSHVILCASIKEKVGEREEDFNKDEKSGVLQNGSQMLKLHGQHSMNALSSSSSLHLSGHKR